MAWPTRRWTAAPGASPLGVTRRPPRTQILDADDPDVRRRFRDGDPDAVRAVYARFARPLLSLCRSHLADVEQAKDAVQQTFIQALAGGPVLRPRPPARTLAVPDRPAGLHRPVPARAGRRPSTSTITPATPRSSVAGPSMERSWIVWEVRQAIDALPPEGREIIRLLHLEGYTVEQVAARAGAPGRHGQVALVRSRRRLAAMLGHLRTQELAA